MKKNYWLLLFTLLASGCFYDAKDFDLTEKERQFLAPFKKGDTLYFESSKKDLTAIIVIGIDSEQKRESGWLMAKPAYNRVYVTIKNLYFEKEASGKFHAIQQDSLYDNSDYLIYISKIPQQRRTDYSFSFRHTTYNSEKLPTEKHNDTIVIYPDSPQEIECLYWKKDSGLIGYKFPDGTYWMRTASPNYGKD